MGMQLTTGQKQSYADDGFLIVRDVFAAAELERLERGAVAAVQDGGPCTTWLRADQARQLGLIEVGGVFHELRQGIGMPSGYSRQPHNVKPVNPA